MLEIVPLTKAFTDAAIALYPKHYDISNAIIAIEAVKNNVFEDKMWETLKDYFIHKHELDIDENLVDEGAEIIFNMISTKQITNGKQITNEIIKLKIIFVGTTNIIATVGSIIVNMKAKLNGEDDMYNLEYNSNSQEFTFIIRYDRSFNPNSFVLKNNSNGEEIEYFNN
jgi:hypothetical protein